MKRFPKLGTFREAHWQGWVIESGGVPGPTDTFIQGLVVLDPQTLTALKAGYTWTTAPKIVSTQINAELRPFLPPTADWRYSEQFTSDVVTNSFHGDVYLDPASATVFLDVISS